MRFGDKTKPTHHPVLKPANLPDFLAGARNLAQDYPRFSVR
jgi:hypothetical protein